ncbi:glucagon family neuropeptides-like [Protopterus annectens]|uniref:glucagon family neuropeptides-like n=1 Tax=Protopterus annectens TaxID=7888 RepID=UPI001CFA0C6B|nr:glucagon family neuropeptides-like [Protopterus annectens]
MLNKAAFLVLVSLAMQSVCSPLYPALRYNQKVSGKMMNLAKYSQPTQAVELSLENYDFQGDPARERMERHADAIFTKTYKDVLKQISIRRALQTILDKHGSDQKIAPKGLTKRSSNGVYTDSSNYDYRQPTLMKYLSAVLSNPSFEDIHSNQLPEEIATILQEDYGNDLEEQLKLPFYASAATFDFDFYFYTFDFYFYTFDFYFYTRSQALISIDYLYSTTSTDTSYITEQIHTLIELLKFLNFLRKLKDDEVCLCSLG